MMRELSKGHFFLKYYFHIDFAMYYNFYDTKLLLKCTIHHLLFEHANHTEKKVIWSGQKAVTFQTIIIAVVGYGKSRSPIHSF